ncbi:hypothetical protein BHM03_00050712 [Ensete ventricosum]|nr:hypothetical protein BHM03_00050712 [Ensete ventricosum]
MEKVEHIIREENMMAAQEILELFCELIAVRLPIIESQRFCSYHFVSFYGRNIMLICFANIHKGCHYNPFPEAKSSVLQFFRECPLDLKEAISTICFAAPRCVDLPELQQVQMLFAAKYGKEFVTAATYLLPDCGVNRQVTLTTKIINSDSLDLPQVPKDPVRATIDFPSALGNVSSEPPSAHELGFGRPAITKSISSEDMPQVPPVEPAVSEFSDPTSSPNQSNAVIAANKQFIPFVSPPPLSSFSAPPKQNEFSDPTTTWLSSTSQPAPSPSPPSSSISPSPNRSEYVLPPPPPPPPLSSFPDHQAQNEPASSQPSFSSRAKCEVDVDLQDVLAAAQSAAETAERAAIAARAAANLAQVRITDLLTKSESGGGNESHGQGFEEQTDLANPIFHDQQSSFCNNNEKSTDYGLEQIWDSHEPQSSPVSEDEAYLSYPNLFASKDSDLKSDYS